VSAASTVARPILTIATDWCNCFSKVVALAAIVIVGLASFLQALSFELALQSGLLFSKEGRGVMGWKDGVVKGDTYRSFTFNWTS